MDKEAVLIFSAVFVVAFAGLISEALSPEIIVDDISANYVYGASLDEDFGVISPTITGDASWRKKLKRAARKVEKQVSRTSQRVEAEVNRVDDNLKKAADKIEAEGKRFGKRTNAEWQRFDDRVINEVERYGNRVEDEFNRIDDNIKKLGDKAEEEYKRLIKRVREEVDTQKDVLKSLSKGNICQTYNAAQKSDLYDAKKWVYDQVLPVIKPILRPHVAAIVSRVAAPINAIPLIGQAIYVTVVPIATEWGTDYAAKKVIREALEECN